MAVLEALVAVCLVTAKMCATPRHALLLLTAQPLGKQGQQKFESTRKDEPLGYIFSARPRVNAICNHDATDDTACDVISWLRW